MYRISEPISIGQIRLAQLCKRRLCFSGNIGQVARKITCFHYLTKYSLHRSIQKKTLFTFEIKIAVFEYKNRPLCLRFGTAWFVTARSICKYLANTSIWLGNCSCARLKLCASSKWFDGRKPPDWVSDGNACRTSGEMRLSNFLLWDLAYTELYFTPKLWPDFREEDFVEAIEWFASRNRRFGRRWWPCLAYSVMFRPGCRRVFAFILPWCILYFIIPPCRLSIGLYYLYSLPTWFKITKKRHCQKTATRSHRARLYFSLPGLLMTQC